MKETPAAPDRLLLPPAGMPRFDFHTHDTLAPAGQAVISMPACWLVHPHLYLPRAGAMYSAGIHPWWTADEEQTRVMLRNLPRLLRSPQVVALGEVGIDLLRGGSVERQEAVLEEQLRLTEKMAAGADRAGGQGGQAERPLPVIFHIVRAYDRLLRLHKLHPGHAEWTVHGFRGGAALARQLAAAGIALSFGTHGRPEAIEAVPPHLRRYETDAPDRGTATEPCHG